MIRMALPAALLLTVLVATADEPLVTDRPDQTESAETVPPGTLQIEVGYTRLEVDQPGVEAEISSFPQTLFRYGLLERWELRLSYAGYQRIDPEMPSGPDVRGSGDVSIGFKWQVAEDGGGPRRPQIALHGGLDLASGDRDLRRDEADPFVRLSVAHTLTDRDALGWNLGVRLDTVETTPGDEDGLSSLFWTAAWGRSLGGGWGAFVEAFGQTGLSADGGATNSLDAGLAWQFRPRMQLDIAAGREITSGDDRFVTLGFSYRTP